MASIVKGLGIGDSLGWHGAGLENISHLQVSTPQLNLDNSSSSSRIEDAASVTLGSTSASPVPALQYRHEAKVVGRTQDAADALDGVLTKAASGAEALSSTAMLATQASAMQSDLTALQSEHNRIRLSGGTNGSSGSADDQVMAALPTKTTALSTLSSAAANPSAAVTEIQNAQYLANGVTGAARARSQGVATEETAVDVKIDVNDRAQADKSSDLQSARTEAFSGNSMLAKLPVLDAKVGDYDVDTVRTLVDTLDLAAKSMSRAKSENGEKKED